MAAQLTAPSPTSSHPRKRKSDFSSEASAPKKVVTETMVTPEKAQFAQLETNFAESSTVTTYINQDSLDKIGQVSDAHSVTNGDRLESTSPASLPTSQTSQASLVTETPSTAPSSFDEDTTSTVSPKDQNNITGLKLHVTPVEPTRSRSSSIGSVDTMGRSSTRRRKPTEKAQALADAGTRFFRDLQQRADLNIVDNGPINPENQIGSVESNILEAPATEEQSEATTDKISEPLSTLVDSDEVAISVEIAPVRSSPRRRKPTARAVTTADPPLQSRKRTGSPMDSERPSKTARTSLNAPKQPSKLRESVLSAKNDADEVPKSKIIEAERQDETAGSIVCDLNCLSEGAALLAFARFAAEGLDNESDDDSEFNLEAELLALENDATVPMILTSEQMVALCRCALPNTELSSDKDLGQNSAGNHKSKERRPRHQVPNLKPGPKSARPTGRRSKGQPAHAAGRSTRASVSKNDSPSNGAMRRDSCQHSPIPVTQPLLDRQTNESRIQVKRCAKQKEPHSEYNSCQEELPRNHADKFPEVVPQKSPSKKRETARTKREKPKREANGNGAPDYLEPSHEKSQTSSARMAEGIGHLNTEQNNITLMQGHITESHNDTGGELEMAAAIRGGSMKGIQETDIGAVPTGDLGPGKNKTRKFDTQKSPQPSGQQPGSRKQARKMKSQTESKRSKILDLESDASTEVSRTKKNTSSRATSTQATRRTADSVSTPIFKGVKKSPKSSAGADKPSRPSLTITIKMDPARFQQQLKEA